MAEPSLKRRPTPRELEKVRAGVPIAEFRARKPPRRLSPHERHVLLDALEGMFAGIYTHLPLKRARYGFDPVQRLRILRTQVNELAGEAFDAEVDDIFNSLRDAHTVYERPGYEGRVAALPCIIEMYGHFTKPRYVVSRVGDWGRKNGFAPGVEVETWNGVPIDRAVQRFGDQESGGRADSMRAFAVASLTFRALCLFALPDEDEVVVGFRGVDAAGRPVGKRRYVTLPWRVLDARFVTRFRDAGAKRRNARTVRVRAIHPAAAAIKQAKLLMFAPEALQGVRRSSTRKSAAAGPGGKVREFPTGLPDFLRAWTVRGVRPEDEYGYLRIFEFDVPSVRGFLQELRSLLAQMPPRGLIVDIRGNPGGVVVAAEMALQFFTPKTIEPVRFSLLATDFVRQFCRRVANRAEYAPWIPSLEAAVRNGEQYSAPFPITDPSRCNEASQVYGGPVILVADSTTYSSGDIFSAGFVDNGIGPLVCVGAGTGAGGASVSDYESLRVAVAGSRVKLPRLPEGGSVLYSMLRLTRIGPHLGAPIEDVGVSVPPTRQYAMTRDDVMHANRDLLAHCVRWLAKQPYTVMSVQRDGRRRKIEIATQGLDQLDVRLDARQLASVPLRPRDTFTLDVPPGTRRVELCGLRGGTLKQRRVIDKTSVLDG